MGIAVELDSHTIFGAPAVLARLPFEHGGRSKHLKPKATLHRKA